MALIHPDSFEVHEDEYETMLDMMAEQAIQRGARVRVLTVGDYGNHAFIGQEADVIRVSESGVVCVRFANGDGMCSPSWRFYKLEPEDCAECGEEA